MRLDYHDEILRGHSFKGQDLTGANFSGADIRGADFSDAILKDADFRRAEAGLQKRWVIGLLIVSCLLSPVSGYLSISIGLFIALILHLKNTPNFVIGIVSLVLMAVFLIVASRKAAISNRQGCIN